MINTLYSWMALYENSEKEIAEKVIVAPNWVTAANEAAKEQRLNPGWRLHSMRVLSEMPVLFTQQVLS